MGRTVTETAGEGRPSRTLVACPGPLETSDREDLTKMQRLLPILIFMLVAASGCSRCGDSGEPGAGAERAPAGVGVAAVPATPAAVTHGLAELIPADAAAFVVMRDWERLFGILPGIRERLPGEASAIAQAETDLRNTYGIRLDDPESLRTLGVAPNGGVAVAVLEQTPVAVFYLSDPDAFSRRTHEILTEQPFAYRGAVRERVVADVLLRAFPAVDDGPAQITTGRWRNHGFLFPAGVADDAVDAATRSMREAAGESMAERDDLRQVIGRTDGMAFVGLLSADLIPDEDGIGTTVSALAGGERLGFGLHPRSNGVDVRLLPPLRGRELTQLREIVDAPAPHASFGRVPGPEAWGVIRLTARPQLLMRAARGDEASAQVFDSTLRSAGQLFQLDIEQELVPALGHNVILGFSRVRAMTLIRALSADDVPGGDVLDALGTVMAVELTDRDVILSALERVAAAAGEEINRFEDRGYPVFTVRDPRANLLSVTVHDRMLIIASERQRGATLDRLAGEADPTPLLIRDDDMVQMLTAPGAVGGYLNLGHLLTGPLGTALDAQVPFRLSRVAVFADQAFGRLRLEDAGIRIDLGLRYAPAARTR